MAVPEALLDLIRAAAGGEKFPATQIYCEGWLLRLALELSQRHSSTLNDPQPSSGRRRWPLTFKSADRWYSEARIDSPFPRVSRHGTGERPEGATNADAVITDGELVSKAHRARFSAAGATRVDVIEAKLGSPLSAGTKHSKSYHQAARNVACLIWTALRHQLDPTQVQLGFWVMAPESQYNASRRAGRHAQAPTIAEALDPAAIQQAIRDRASAWLEGLGPADRRARETTLQEQLKTVDAWLDSADLKLDIGFISFEDVGRSLRAADASAGTAFENFYAVCKRENGVV